GVRTLSGGSALLLSPPLHDRSEWRESRAAGGGGRDGPGSCGDRCSACRPGMAGRRPPVDCRRLSADAVQLAPGDGARPCVMAEYRALVRRVARASGVERTQRAPRDVVRARLVLNEGAATERSAFPRRAR